MLLKVEKIGQNYIARIDLGPALEILGWATAK